MTAGHRVRNCIKKTELTSVESDVQASCKVTRGRVISVVFSLIFGVILMSILIPGLQMCSMKSLETGLTDVLGYKFTVLDGVLGFKFTVRDVELTDLELLGRSQKGNSHRKRTVLTEK